MDEREEQELRVRRMLKDAQREDDEKKGAKLLSGGALRLPKEVDRGVETSWDRCLRCGAPVGGRHHETCPWAHTSTVGAVQTARVLGANQRRCIDCGSVPPQMGHAPTCPKTEHVRETEQPKVLRDPLLATATGIEVRAASVAVECIRMLQRPEHAEAQAWSIGMGGYRVKVKRLGRC